jgi:ATP-dependent Lon protease
VRGERPQDRAAARVEWTTRAPTCRFGTAASVLRLVTGRDGAHHIICQGEQRFRVREYLSGYPYFVARVERLTEPETVGTEVEARMQTLRERARELIEHLPLVPAELVQAIEQVSTPGMLADMLAAVLDLDVEDKQEILATSRSRRAWTGCWRSSPTAWR